MDGILSAMAWLGMDPDEGPYRQSERSDRYTVAIDALWDAGFLYACDCTRDDVAGPDEGQRHPRLRRLLPGAGPPRGPGAALRFRTPTDGRAPSVHDLVRGDGPTFPH